MAKLKVKKGLEANLPAVEDGSLLITTDSKKLYLDNGAERIQVGGDSSSAGTYLFHLKFTDGTETAVTNIDGDSDKLYNAVQNGLCVIARVHDYENMQQSRDFYLFNEFGSSEGVSGPFRFFRVSDKGELQIIGIHGNNMLTEEITHTTRNLSATTVTFTKSTTSDNEYTCSESLWNISNTPGMVLGRIYLDPSTTVTGIEDAGYTLFYRVYNIEAQKTADGEVVTFVSCDGNTIKKLTSQYSDQGVWHYSEQSLSGGGADASIYTTDGIVKSDGVKFKSSSTSDAYLTVSDGNKNAVITGKVPATFTSTALAKVTLGAEINPTADFGIKTQKLVWDSAGSNSAYPALYPVLEYGTTATLGAQGKQPWTHAYISNLENTNTISWASNSSSTFSELKIGANPGRPSVIIDSDRVTLKSPNTTVGMGGQQESEILADTSLGATPSGSNFAASRLKLTVRQSGGPVGSGQSKDHSLVFGFTDAVTCKLYPTTYVNLGDYEHPWGSIYFGNNGSGNIYNQGRDLSTTTSGSVDQSLTISNVLGTLPTSTTSTAGGTSYIHLQTNSWYQPTGTTRYTGKGSITISTYNNSSQVYVKMYPNAGGSANLLSPGYYTYLGDTANAWTYIYGSTMYAGSLYNHPGLSSLTTGNAHRVPVFWGLKTSSTLPTASDGVREGDMCYLVSGTYQVSLRIYYGNVWCTLATT